MIHFERLFRPSVAAMVSLLCPFALCACRPPAPGGAMQYLCGVNASGSNSSQLGSSIYLLSRLAGMADGSDWLKVTRVDATCRVVYRYKPVPADIEEFQLDLVKSCQALAKETGTHSIAFWTDALSTARNRKPAKILYFTDGFEEGASGAEIARLVATGRRIAACKNVRGVYLLGVDPSQQRLWRAVFREMGPRLHLEGPITTSTINKVEAAVDEG